MYYKQWKWLNKELKECLQNNQNVWLLFHAPPNNDIINTNYKKNLLHYISKYKNIIKATFSGHIHNDNFKIFINNNKLSS